MGSSEPPPAGLLHHSSSSPPKSLSPGQLQTHPPRSASTSLAHFVQKTSTKVPFPVEISVNSNPLWMNCLVGHFLGEAPHIGKVHATVNRIWNSPTKPFKIDAQFLSPKVVLFRIPNSEMRDRVLDRKFWYVGDIPLVVQVWSPSTAQLKPDLTSMPLWIDLYDVPDTLYSEEGLRFLGDQVGSFQRIHPNTLRCVRLDVARILVSVNLQDALISEICLQDET